MASKLLMCLYFCCQKKSCDEQVKENILTVMSVSEKVYFSLMKGLQRYVLEGSLQNNLD